MFGGPAVGVAVFVIIAILLGWGLISLFGAMLDQTQRELSESGGDHGFVAGGLYLTDKPMLLGYLADGRVVLFPDRADLPAHARGRRTAPTVAGYRADPDASVDLIGVVEQGTAIRIEEVIEDADNAQTRLLVRIVVLDGPFAEQSAIGLHLEDRSTDPQTGRPRYDPRPELLIPARPADRPDPLQSPGNPAGSSATPDAPIPPAPPEAE